MSKNNKKHIFDCQYPADDQFAVWNESLQHLGLTVAVASDPILRTLSLHSLISDLNSVRDLWVHIFAGSIDLGMLGEAYTENQPNWLKIHHVKMNAWIDRRDKSFPIFFGNCHT